MKTVMSSNAERIKLTPAAADHAHGRVLELQVTQLLTPEDSKRLLSVQGRIYQDGILMLAGKFYDTGRISPSMTVCESLLELATNVGGNVADWVQDSKMPACDKVCVGLHPDEPIAIGREILPATPTAIDADALACNWPSQMVKDFMADVDDMHPPLPSKLVVTDEDILKYPGRKLVLKAVAVRLNKNGPGDKWMRMTGELLDGGVHVANFRAYQKVRFGIGSTCRVLNSLSENMYQSIETWLVNPTPNAELL
jgi:hypothetical protein